MPVIPYLPRDLDEPRDLVAAIRARRGGELIELDRMLLHSPPFAAGWNQFLRAVRTELAIPSRLAELAICAVAVLNGAAYELYQHGPEFLKAGGTEAELGALQRLAHEGIDERVFGATEQAVLALTIAMTRAVAVPAATMNAVRSALAGDRQVVEIVGVIATYNMVSRFLVALGVEVEPPGSAAESHPT